MADYLFDDWKDMLSDFQDCVQNDLEEIRKQKNEIQQMKAELLKELETIKFYRDDNCLVISAPKVIIGNVDQTGDLYDSMGEVIIKGSKVSLDGVGETGSITSRAPSIRQFAVDPGSDGVENVVQDTSEIVNQACNIVIESNDATDAFSYSKASAGKGGIRIHADNNLELEASVSSENRKEAIENTIDALESQISTLEEQMSSQKEDVENLFDGLKSLLEDQEELNDEDFLEKNSNTLELSTLNNQIQDMLPMLCQSTMAYVNTISRLAEANRRKSALQTEKDEITDSDSFKSETTGAALQIKAETISMETVDGDNNLHTNDEAGISIRTPRMGVSLMDDDGALTEDSVFTVRSENINLLALGSENDGKNFNPTGSVTIMSKDISIEAMDYELNDDNKTIEKQLTDDGKINITAKNIEVSTASPSDVKRDDSGNLSSGEYKSEGDVLFKTKTFTIESLDYEVSDGDLKMKSLTDGGEISVRAEKTSILAADNEGKATGSINLNAKAVKVKSMDVDKDSLEDSALAEGSTMLLVSEKMYMGSKSDSVKSKKVQLVSEEIGAFADNTFEAQQGEKKAVVQLADSKASVSGDKSQIYGETTIYNKAEIKDKLTGTEGSFKVLKASTAFSSANITDGSGSASGSSSDLSTKLSKEDAS